MCVVGVDLPGDTRCGLRRAQHLDDHRRASTGSRDVSVASPAGRACDDDELHRQRLGHAIADEHADALEAKAEA